MAETQSVAIDPEYYEMLAQLCELDHRSKKNQIELLVLEAWKAAQPQPAQPQPAQAEKEA